MKKFLLLSAFVVLAAGSVLAEAVAPIADPTPAIQTSVNSMLTFGLTTMASLVGVGTLIWVIKKARKGL